MNQQGTFLIEELSCWVSGVFLHKQHHFVCKPTYQENRSKYWYRIVLGSQSRQKQRYTQQATQIVISPLLPCVLRTGHDDDYDCDDRHSYCQTWKNVDTNIIHKSFRFLRRCPTIVFRQWSLFEDIATVSNDYVYLPLVYCRTFLTWYTTWFAPIHEAYFSTEVTLVFTKRV